MDIPSRPASAVRHALWLGGLLVVLGGLFGMHGLDIHGGAAMDSVASATMAGPDQHPGAAARSVLTETAHDAAVVAVQMTNATGHAGMDMGAAGMCMAVLVLSVIALLLLTRARHLEPLLWLVARPGRAPGPRGRDPDPPSLIRLSIQRC